MTLRYTQPVKLFAISVILFLSATLTHAQNSSPEAIYFHGNILTGAHLLPNDPSETPEKVTAIAISQGKITAIGIDANIRKLKGPQTKLIDLNSAFAMPGFNAAHTHIAYGGQQKLTIDLDGVTSLAEMQQRIKAFATTAKPGTWLQGGRSDHNLWTTTTLPTCASKDPDTALPPPASSRT